MTVRHLPSSIAHRQKVACAARDARFDPDSADDVCRVWTSFDAETDDCELIGLLIGGGPMVALTCDQARDLAVSILGEVERVEENAPALGKRRQEKP